MFTLTGTSTIAHADYSKYSCRGPTKGPIEAIVQDDAVVLTNKAFEVVCLEKRNHGLVLTETR